MVVSSVGGDESVNVDNKVAVYAFSWFNESTRHLLIAGLKVSHGGYGGVADYIIQNQSR